jgi:CP family cyanate transporter-like MFS transporter
VALTPRSLFYFAVAGIVLLALGIRTGVAAVSPIAGLIELDVALVGLPLGALGTIPPLAYALAAAFSPRLARLVGLEGSALVVAGLGILAHVWRGLSPSYLSLFIATVVLMVAAGVGNVILPALVKLYAPKAIGPVTAAYATAMAFSSSAPAVVGVWLAGNYGWRISLASWAVVSIVGGAPWLVVLLFARKQVNADATIADTLPISVSPSVPYSRSPTAVSIMIIFATSGATAYSWFALLPLILTDRAGLNVTEAALALGLFGIMGLPVALVIPPLTVRKGFAGPLVSVAILFGLGGLSGLLFAPALAPFLWVVMIAIASMTFHMSLALIGHRTANHMSALVLSGFVNRVGYLFAGLGPILVGLAYQLTGGWELSLSILLFFTLFQIPAVWILARERSVDEELRESSR